MPQTLLTQEPATAPRKRCAKKRAPPSQGGWAYLPLITSTALAGIPKDGPTGHTDTLAVHIFSALNSSVEELGTARLVCRSWAQAVGSVPLTLTLTGFRDIAAGPRGTSPHPRGWQRTFRGVDSLVLDVDDKQRAFQILKALEKEHAFPHPLRSIVLSPGCASRKVLDLALPRTGLTELVLDNCAGLMYDCDIRVIGGCLRLNRLTLHGLRLEAPPPGEAPVDQSDYDPGCENPYQYSVGVPPRKRDHFGRIIDSPLGVSVNGFTRLFTMHLERTQSLTFLDLSFSADLGDEHLAALAGQKALRALTLREVGQGGAEHIKITNKGLQSLASLPNLVALDLSHVKWAINGEGLSGLTGLTELDISRLDRATDRRLHPLSELTNPQMIGYQYIDRKGRVNSGDGVSDACLTAICRSLTRLERLNLQNNRRVTDVGSERLKELPRLSWLDVRGCAMVSIDALAMLRGHSSLRTRQVQPLAGCLPDSTGPHAAAAGYNPA
mmetsp:Transcript_27999/g.72048  ORF Transcript_27999/g.72048 Transcript_27999/m.72048 type:complete len:496 (+) Transcript_27999:139-1626(+)|eukprot:jgi/Tetstr1/439124/TSEL_002989.t1